MYKSWLSINMGENTDMLGFFSLLKTNMYSSYNIEIEREKISVFFSNAKLN